MNNLIIKKEVVFGLIPELQQLDLPFLPKVPPSVTDTEVTTVFAVKIASASFRYSCPCCDTVLCGTIEIELP